MSDELTVQIIIPPEDIMKLLKKLEAVSRRDVIEQSLYQGGLHIAGWIKNNRLTGPRPAFLGVVTGRLRSSIATSRPDTIGNTYFVRIGTNVEYARIHEFGGTITPKKGKYLKFKTLDGFWHSVTSVNIPARPFLRPGIQDEENKQWVLDNLKENIINAMNEAN